MPGAVHYTLAGLSHNSYTVVGFYEKGPLQARLSYTWRDEYLVAAADTDRRA